MTDIRVVPDSTMVGVQPMTPAAREWIDDNVANEAYQWLGNILWVEARYALPLLRGAHDAGLVVA